MELELLGKRICIIGTSAAGKSTLAQQLANHLNLAICHLDQIAHIPNTNWQPRDRELMRQDHQVFLIQHEQWVIGGNYSYLMPERLAQATAVIWLDYSRWNSVYRYIKRCLIHQPHRAGNLKGATQQFSWKMVRHILIHVPKNKAKYQKLLSNTNLHCIQITSFNQLLQYYKFWNINSSV